MSTKPPIYCFNHTAEKESECIYEKCPMFSKVKDLCRLEHFKESAMVNPFKPDEKPVIPTQTTPTQSTDDSIESKLSDYANELDFSYLPDIVAPKKFMGDNWTAVMDILRPLGYSWVRDGKKSRWEYGEQAPRERDLSGFGKSDTEVDISEIEWNVKDGDNTVQARSGEKAWAFVMGYDRDKKESTGEPKFSTQALHDYLQQTDHYCDGEYVYFMNKDASFFSREPLP